jgi:predicted transcriptional regulator of viral defense system
MKKILPYNDIELQLKKLAVGEIFDNSYFNIERTQMLTLAKLLSRKVQSGQLSRLTKGKYYKPKNTIFGTLNPDSQQVIKSITHKNGKTIGYVTGIKAYQERRFTTQVPSVIEIAIQGKTKSILQIGNYRFRFVERKFAFTVEQIPLLQLLDALKDIKKIPDTTVSETIKTIKAILKDMNQNDIQTMILLAQHYPPFVKALLGAIVEEVQGTRFTETLLEQLNPMSVYKVGVQNDVLKNKKTWKII